MGRRSLPVAWDGGVVPPRSPHHTDLRPSCHHREGVSGEMGGRESQRERGREHRGERVCKDGGSESRERWSERAPRERGMSIGSRC